MIKEVEKKLDNKFKGNFFFTKRAKHKDTYKIKNNVTEKTIADFTKPKNKIPYIERKNIRYVPLNYIKLNVERKMMKHCIVMSSMRKFAKK